MYAYEVLISPPGPTGPRFSAYGRGCGNGYVQSYETNDGHFVSEGVVVFTSQKGARKNVNLMNRNALSIIDKVSNYRDHEGNAGERAIVELQRNDGKGTMISIMFYDGSDMYRFVDAPSLDLALEFEQYLIGTDYRSPI